jgi:sirohydrochlorin cobaltochelatase
MTNTKHSKVQNKYQNTDQSADQTVATYKKPIESAIILFGHGSRDTLWHLPIQAVAQRVRSASPTTNVTCAYLELTEPSLASSAAALVESGARHITILPMFLGVGRHAREDLPALITELKENHPTVVFQVQPAVGENPAVLDLLAHIALSSPVSS